MNFGLDATTAATVWATIGLVVFLGIALYFGMHKAVARQLDNRIAKVQADLDEAARLRAEAQAMLDGFARRRVEAEAEAQGIVDAAKAAAQRMNAEAAQSLEQLIVRRTKAVEDKIAQAEAKAIDEVRARSADVAVEAARIILSQQAAEKGDALVDRSIQDVAARLN